MIGSLLVSNQLLVVKADRVETLAKSETIHDDKHNV